MFAIGLLLFLVSYIFAVMCTQLFADLYPTYTDVDYWGRLDATFFSLFQIMTLDNWSAIARQTMVAYPYAWLPIIVFVIVTGFVVVNLIIAVICDAISALHEDDKAKLHGNFRDVSGQDSDLLDEGMSSSINDSVHHALELDVREQLSALETHVEELTKMQEETMLTLQMLTSSLAKHRQRRQQQCHEKKLLRRGRQLPNSSPGTAKSTAVLVQPMKVTD
jgi:voltage-gated sodium channel